MTTIIPKLVRQKRVVAQDYPFFVTSVWKKEREYSVTLDKVDLGYNKRLFTIEYNNPLEAFVKFEQTVDECIDGRYDMLPIKEGEAFE